MRLGRCALGEAIIAGTAPRIAAVQREFFRFRFAHAGIGFVVLGTAALDAAGEAFVLHNGINGRTLRLHRAGCSTRVYGQGQAADRTGGHVTAVAARCTAVAMHRGTGMVGVIQRLHAGVAMAHKIAAGAAKIEDEEDGSIGVKFRCTMCGAAM